MKIKTSRTSFKNDKNEFTSFTSTGEGLVAITLEVNLNSFSEDELVKELCLRGDINDLNKIDLLETMEISTELTDIYEENNGKLKNISVMDMAKFQHLMEVFSRYSLNDVQERLP